MDHDDACFGTKRDFSEWLKINNLHSYQAAFEEEGFDLASLCLLTEEDVEEFKEMVRAEPFSTGRLTIQEKDYVFNHADYTQLMCRGDIEMEDGIG